MKPNILFTVLLEKIAGQTELQSVETLRSHAACLTTEEFHLLLGRAIRQPERLESRLKESLGRSAA